MSSSVFNQGSANGKLATSTSDSDADKNSIHDETFAEDEDLDDAEGLFGSDEEEEEAQTSKPKSRLRSLDEEGLGSGYDEDGQNQEAGDVDGYENEVIQERAQTILDVGIGRHAIPKPSDGELYLLQFPNFLGIESKAFHHAHFQPPTTDHHSSTPASSTFSSYQTSNNTIRWRYSPRNPVKIQSNARILRWSDGSLTIQVASNAREQFELAAKPLAPPHITPFKAGFNAANRGRTTNGPPPYDSRLDSHTYLTAPHEQAGLIRITNHVTSSLAVKSSTDQNDDALLKLQQSLAAATKGNKSAADGGLEIINISEDPELAKKKAEVAEKEKLRAQRRRQQQEERERDRSNRALGRSGFRPGGLGAGLTIGGLEDDDGMGTSRTRMSKPKKPTRRRNSEYSDDEEEFRGMGRTREDEYDENDGFLVPSDEEPEIGGDGTDDDPEIDDGSDEKLRNHKKSGSRKGPRVTAREEEVTTGRLKRRRIIDDEDEE